MRAPAWRSRRWNTQCRNTESGKSGVFCAICHSIAETRDTPYHTLARQSPKPVPAEPEPARILCRRATR